MGKPEFWNLLVDENDGFSRRIFKFTLVPFIILLAPIVILVIVMIEGYNYLSDKIIERLDEYGD